MGRTDAWALNLPEPPPVMPEAQSASQTAGAQLLEMLGRKPDSSKLLDAVKAAPVAASAHSAPATSRAPARSSCPSCKASMSAVEQKLERCLTCGTSFTAGDVKVSVGI
jgi:hypothetical protein